MAYGAIAAPSVTVELSTLGYSLPNDRRLVCFPLTADTADPELVEYLAQVFNDELATGRTYPQEGPLTVEGFKAYFFAATAIVGLITESAEDKVEDGTKLSGVDISSVKGARSWKEAVGGVYYVKPNYPYRSAHNAGFLIPNTHRGLRIGLTLGKSYLIYAPLLGYRASVFNLVYKTNTASAAIWDRLGFSKVGCIPKAGKLVVGPNGEEEYVDAWVYWKSFVDE